MVVGPAEISARFRGETVSNSGSLWNIPNIPFPTEPSKYFAGFERIFRETAEIFCRSDQPGEGAGDIFRKRVGIFGFPSKYSNRLTMDGHGGGFPPARGLKLYLDLK